MPTRLILRFTPILALVCLVVATGSTRRDNSLDALTRDAAVIVRGTVEGNQSYRDPATGRVMTRSVIAVGETLKGRAPALLEVVHPGGQINGVAHASGLSPELTTGAEYVLFLQRGPGRKLSAVGGTAGALRLAENGRAPAARTRPNLLRDVRSQVARAGSGEDDVTDQAALATGLDDSGPAFFGGSGGSGGGSISNLLVDGTYGYGFRQFQPDIGAPIPYQLDAASLPAGINSNQAAAAVQAALNQWAGATAITFEFLGWTNFGQAADLFTNRDSTLRIQLHNNFNVPLQGDTVGIGGASYSTFVVNSTWGSGGSVNGFEFHQVFNPYVVLAHTNVSLQNTNILAEVLCHEIGHALGLAHTSTDPGEPTNSSLYQSIMYFSTHGDNRGALINSVDRDNLCQTYSSSNTPPWVLPRFLDITTAASAPSLPGVNEIQFKAWDLQGGATNVAIAEATFTFGEFSLTNDLVQFRPATNLSGPRVDPANFEFYDGVYARASDGTNASPFVNVDVISLNTDNTGPMGDGLPDAWMIINFGASDPAAGPNRGPHDDFDGDGYTNLEEYQMGFQSPVTLVFTGASPVNGALNQRILNVTASTITFQAKPWEVYELEGSTNLTTWSPAAIPVQPTTTNGIFHHKLGTNAPAWYFRVRRVP